ncbi:MAG: nitrilase-related carbon-nitrogen hydrolase [Candidatus Magasanikbacteria bacterium]
MKIGFYQFAPRLGDVEFNIGKMEHALHKIKADIIITPELSITGYSFRTRKEIMSLMNKNSTPTIMARLQKISRTIGGLLMVGMVEQDGNQLFDSLLAVGPGGCLAKNQKTHLFFKEKKIFNYGKTGPTVFKYKNTKIGLGICYDYMFPEYWRKLSLLGATLFCNSANFVYHYGFDLMRARAIENGVFSVCVNRIGIERGNKFYGRSEMVDNHGNIIYQSSQSEDLRVQDLDIDKAQNKWWNKYNNLFNDRRPEYY